MTSCQPSMAFLSGQSIPLMPVLSSSSLWAVWGSLNLTLGTPQPLPREHAGVKQEPQKHSNSSRSLTVFPFWNLHPHYYAILLSSSVRSLSRPGHAASKIPSQVPLIGWKVKGTKV